MNIRPAVALTLFTLVALASFCCWAFGGNWFSSEPLLYTACAVVFLGLGGVALLPGLPQEERCPLRFTISFGLGFLAYAVIWSILWFSLPTTLGEILGSGLGIAALVAVLDKRHSLQIPYLPAVSLVFLFHTVGYYAGDFFYIALQGRGPRAISLDMETGTVRTIARLSWGLFYGLGLGSGILSLFQDWFSRVDKPSTQI